MPTWIRFSAVDKDYITVEEDIEAVMEAFNAGHGNPFPVSAERSGKRLYVNPQRVAYWHAQREPGGPPPQRPLPR